MSDHDLTTRIARLEQERDEAVERYLAVSAMFERSNDHAHIIYNISKAIASTHDLAEMVPRSIAILRKAIGFSRVTLYLVNDRKTALELRFAEGIPGAARAIGIGEGLPGRIVEVGDHAHIHDLALFYETLNDFVHVPDEEKRDGSYIGIALRSSNAAIGVLGIDTPKKYGLTVEDMDFLVLIAPLLCAGIEKASLFATTELLSRCDGLTGLFNRRVFVERLEHEINRRNRTRRPVALIMLDIDHFKRINDRFGHQEGDAVLRELAGVLNGQCRHTTIDACFRYGGEEFALILPEEDLERALFVAERVRKAVETHPFGVAARHPGTSLTVSLGVAVAGPDEQISPDQFLRRADDALYASKRNGRNRVSH
jgi:diguanylate cyclase (GGDEF)-like protein